MEEHPRTKIVCTIGPASQDPAVIRGLIQAGMNVARINFSHGDAPLHARSIAAVRQSAAAEGRLVAVMADLQGPKLRVGELPPEGVVLQPGDLLTLVDAPYGPGRIPVPHPEVLHDLRPGQRVLLDDGRLVLVVEKAAEEPRCRVEIGGLLSSHKGFNLPGAALRISALTPKDRRDARFAAEQQVDWIALSFVRSADDIRELRWLLADCGGDGIGIVAKIEKPQALQLLTGILEAADALMVARGDLGVETPPEEVPFHQKQIIAACNRAGKPVITATQMLESMIERPTPTRAEASDVANAILDGADAVMLSGETAVGRYPVETVRTMARICVHAEAHLSTESFLAAGQHSPSRSVTEAISRATVETAVEVGASAILTATMSGTTARMVARYRPTVPIIAFTPDERTLKRLALVWGVTPLAVPHFKTTDEMVALMTGTAQQQGLAQQGERVVLTAGVPFGGEGLTNLLQVHVIGEIEEKSATE